MADTSQVLDNRVNEHYLDKVLDLALDSGVSATEDILDARGNKLIAKGTPISHALQEKLIVHRLAKPLEHSLALDDGLDVGKIVAHARTLVERNPAVGAFVASLQNERERPFELMSQLQFGNALALMVSIMQRAGDAAVDHAIVTSLISIILADRMGMDAATQFQLALAGLVHDVGELYIDPKLLAPEHRLLPHEWKHIIVHPRIGQALLEELDDHPALAAQALGEHHERVDGSGYPRQLSGDQISLPGQILGISDAISSLLVKPESPLERADLAIKLVPGEFSHDLVSVVSGIIRKARTGAVMAPACSADEAQQRVRILSAHIKTVAATSQRMQELELMRSSKAKALIAHAHERIDNLRRCFHSTGLSMCQDGDMGRHSDILFEAVAASREIQWRLRDIARVVALQSESLVPEESELLGAMISMLDSEPDAKQLAEFDASGNRDDVPAVASSATVDDKRMASEIKAPPRKETGEGERVLLLVDDEPSVLAALARTLRPFGYKILKAPDAFNALDLLQVNEIGVVLSDHRMPGMTGVELLSRIKTMYPATVRIILSGYADVQTVTDAIKLGAVYKFMTKPWDHEELVGVLNAAFERYGAQRYAQAH